MLAVWVMALWRSPLLLFCQAALADDFGNAPAPVFSSCNFSSQGTCAGDADAGPRLSTAVNEFDVGHIDLLSRAAVKMRAKEAHTANHTIWNVTGGVDTIEERTQQNINGHSEYCLLPVAQHVHFQESCETYRHMVNSQIDIIAMQQEYESVQLLFRSSSACTVSVRSTSRFPFKWYQVGYVFTRSNKRVQGSGGGWRPDPLLEPFVEGVRVPPHFTQPLWLTWHIDVATPMNESSEVIVTIDGRLAHRIRMSVNVARIAVPSVWVAKVKQLWGFNDKHLEALYGSPLPSGLSREFRDLLYRYRIPPPAEPDDYQRKRVPLVAIPLPYVADSMPDGTEYVNGPQFPRCNGLARLNASSMDTAVATTRKLVDDLLLKGWPHVYGYGKDEPDEACAPLLQQAYTRFRTEIPKLSVIAATNWRRPLFQPSFPLDAWVQLYHKYEEGPASAWVAAGKELWGYHCIEPSAERYMNIFIERPLIHARLLFWLAAARRYDGWLYWVDNLWRASCAETGSGSARHTLRALNSTHPALLDFDPASYIWCPQLSDIFANGDGYYVYPGEHGPVVSQRLEEIRDGIEDLELFRMLPSADVISRHVSKLVRSPTDWDNDPVKLRYARDEALREVAAGPR